MNSKYYCDICKTSFARKYLFTQHLKSKKHLKRAEENVSLYECNCGKSYSHKKSLDHHKKTCTYVEPSPVTLETMQQRLDDFEKERNELRAQIALLLDKHSGHTTHNNNSNNTTNIETQNNTINIHINAFGQENIDYLDEKAIVSCINRIYKSVPAILEKIHFDPEHPENHNIKITNKKLPYASVMGDNQKWKTVDKKDAIETMVFNGYNLLDEKYPDTKSEISDRKQEHFESFQDKFESEDKELRKQLKTDVELLVLNSST